MWSVVVLLWSTRWRHSIVLYMVVSGMHLCISYSPWSCNIWSEWNWSIRLISQCSFLNSFRLLNNLKPGVIRKVNKLRTPIAGLVSTTLVFINCITDSSGAQGVRFRTDVDYLGAVALVFSQVAQGTTNRIWYLLNTGSGLPAKQRMWITC